MRFARPMHIPYNQIETKTNQRSTTDGVYTADKGGFAERAFKRHCGPRENAFETESIYPGAYRIQSAMPLQRRYANRTKAIGQESGIGQSPKTNRTVIWFLCCFRICCCIYVIELIIIGIFFQSTLHVQVIVQSIIHVRKDRLIRVHGMYLFKHLLLCI
jgi:hypothetical protein